MNLYKENTANYDQVRELLSVCDFIPPLRSYVDIDKYAEKIASLAHLVECWAEDELVGMVAMYCNDQESGKCFITSVCVRNDFTGKGIATTMLKKAIEQGINLNFKYVELEVHLVNAQAINTYEKLGFRRGDEYDGKVKMSLTLKDKQ